MVTFDSSDVYQNKVTGIGTFYNAGLYFVPSAYTELNYQIKNYYGCEDLCQGFVFLSFTIYQDNQPIAISLIVSYEYCNIINTLYSVQSQSESIASTFAPLDLISVSALSCPYTTAKYNYDNSNIKVE